MSRPMRALRLAALIVLRAVAIFLFILLGVLVALHTAPARLVQVASALAAKPRLLLLDEPVAGLDTT